MSGGTSPPPEAMPLSGGVTPPKTDGFTFEVDNTEYIGELKRTFTAHRGAVRSVLEQLTSKLESLQRDHLDQQERLMEQYASRTTEVGANGRLFCAPDFVLQTPPSLHTPPQTAQSVTFLGRDKCDIQPRPHSSGVVRDASTTKTASQAWDLHPSAVSEVAVDLTQATPKGKTVEGSFGSEAELSLVPLQATEPGPPPKIVTKIERHPGRPGRHGSVGSMASQDFNLSRAVVEKMKMGKEFVALLKQNHSFAISSKTRDLDLSRMERFVTSFIFKSATTLAIMLNAISIGIQTDDTLVATLQHPEKDEQSPVWTYIEIAFTIFFSMELYCRAVAERSAFVCGKNYKWNMFDLLLVVTSLVSLVFDATNSAAQPAPDFSFARMLRLIRFTRVLRLLRAIRFSQSLRLMLLSILASISSLFWIWMVLSFMIYFWAIFFLTGIIDHYKDKGEHVEVTLVQDHWGSLLEATLSLFMSITGGVDWGDVVQPLQEISPFYTFTFTVYVFFMALGVLNVVVGSFVDNAQQISRNDRDMVIKNEIKQEREYMTRIRSVFTEADKDNDGTLSWEEFEEYLKDDRVAAYLGSLGLDSSIARTLFVLLDVDDTNSVGIDEFVQGCTRLKGQARSIDVNMLLYNSEKMICKIAESMSEIGRRLNELEDSLGVKPAAHDHPESPTKMLSRTGSKSRSRPVASSMPSAFMQDQTEVSSSDGAPLSYWTRPVSPMGSGLGPFSHRHAASGMPIADSPVPPSDPSAVFNLYVFRPRLTL